MTGRVNVDVDDRHSNVCSARWREMEGDVGRWREKERDGGRWDVIQGKLGAPERQRETSAPASSNKVKRRSVRTSCWGGNTQPDGCTLKKK